jgi:hypothetical protein
MDISTFTTSNVVPPQPIAHYDPRSVGTHQVQLTFKMFDYETIRTVEVAGSMRGFEILEYGIEQLYEEIFESDEDEIVPLELRNDKGDVLLFTDIEEDNHDFEWFKSICVEARIVSYLQPDLVIGND